MRKLIVVLPATLIVLALGSGNGFAATTFGGSVYGAFNTYAMGDVNDNLSEINALGGNFDEISNGFTGGLELRLWVNPNWMITAGWEPLFAKTKDDPTNTEFDFQAHDFPVGAAYFFPMSSEKVKYGIGAGVDILTMAGKVEDPSGALGAAGDLSGTAFGFHGLGMAEWTVSPGFAITAGAGYRMANVTDTKLDDRSANPKLETDYSGFIGRVGLAFYMPTK